MRTQALNEHVRSPDVSYCPSSFVLDVICTAIESTILCTHAWWAPHTAPGWKKASTVFPSIVYLCVPEGWYARRWKDQQKRPVQHCAIDPFLRQLESARHSCGRAVQLVCTTLLLCCCVLWPPAYAALFATRHRAWQTACC